MPVVFRHHGYRFLFYSNEGDPREPPHVHAVRDGMDAKFWLDRHIELAYNRGHSAKAVREIYQVIVHRRGYILECWNEFFSNRDPGLVR